MTGPDGPVDRSPVAETSPGPPGRRPSRRPLLSLEGRAAPGLYVLAWLASIAGLGLLFVFVFATIPSGIPERIVFLVGAGSLSLGLIAAAGSQALQRRADGVPGYAGPSPVLVFGATVAVNLALAVPLAVVAGPLGAADPERPTTALVAVLVGFAVNLAAIALLVVGSGALTWREMGVRRPGPGTFVELGRGALYAAPVYLVTAVVAAILVGLLGVEPEGPLPVPVDAAGLATNLLAAAVVAPISEELFYRGFATTAWVRRIGPDRAVWRGAIFFAVVHVLTVSGVTFGEAAPAAAIAFVVRLPVAYALGWLFVRRRSLAAAIGLHAAFNALLIIAAELARGAVPPA